MYFFVTFKGFILLEFCSNLIIFLIMFEINLIIFYVIYMYIRVLIILILKISFVFFFLDSKLLGYVVLNLDYKLLVL